MRVVIFMAIAASVIGAWALIQVYGLRRRRRYNRKKVADAFGNGAGDSSFEGDSIERYWRVKASSLPENHRIDDITWNDLEMDQVYLRINHCQSFAGDQVLYSALHEIGGQGKEYEDFRKKIGYFQSNGGDRDEIWYLISGLGKGKDSYYLPVFIQNLEAFRIPNIGFYRFLQGLLLLSLIPPVIYLDYNYLMLTLMVGALNLVTYTFQKNKYQAYMNMLGGVLGIMNTARQIAGARTWGYEKEFGDLRGKVDVFRRLSRKISKLQFRTVSSLSGDAITLLDSLTFGVTLWDLTQYDKVISSLVGRKEELMGLYQVIGGIDAAISVASFRKSQPRTCTPSFCRDNRIKAGNIYHPLVSNPVCNSIEIDRGCIITGSNASGKSTFIKALAINALLAQSIDTCLADEFLMPRSWVITSMAVRDEVSTGESYYIREIKYMKRIIDGLNDEKPVFCVIDEILRGTNTVERIAASTAILDYLSTKNCIVVAATHDIELTKILEEEYDNFHFTEHIEDRGITFEYKIHKGPSTSRNAVRLLEYMDFPKEIVESAVRRCGDTMNQDS